MFKLSDKETNYYAQVVKLEESTQHPNADRLLIWKVNNYDVITDLSYNTGDICVLFPIECQINPQILTYLNMYEDKTLNSDQEKKGYINSKGRVRAVKLRGIVSDGLLLKVSDFSFAIGVVSGNIFLDKSVGIKFDTYEDIWVCKKYVPVIKEARNTGTGQKPKGPKVTDFLVEGQFQFHGNTPKLQDNAWKINPDDLIVITDKFHGTSAVFSNVLTNRKLNILDKIAKFIGVKVETKEYSKMYSSRTVLKSIDGKYHTKDQGYYNDDIWTTVFNEIKDTLEEGITIYGEIVGFTNNGSAIQKGYDYGCKAQFKIGDTVTKKSGKPFKEGYVSDVITGFTTNPDDPKGREAVTLRDSNTIVSTDMLNETGHKFLVYRITKTDNKGRVIEFSWNQVKEYCYSHNLKHVIELYYGFANEAAIPAMEYEQEIKPLIERLSLMYLEKDCKYCTNKVPAEGLVLRKETGNIEWFKLKSKAFLLKETEQLDKEEASIEDEN